MARFWPEFYIAALVCIAYITSFHHIPRIVQATIGVASAILSAAALSFIGFGIQPPTAMLSVGRSYIRDYWHVVTFPGVTIMLTIFLLNLFGDGLRDALDPRLKR